MEQRPADACRELRRRENTRGGYGANYVIRTCNYLVPGLHRLRLTFNIQMRAALALTPSTQQHVDPRPSNGLWETLLSSHCWARRGTHPKGGIWGNPSQGGDMGEPTPRGGYGGTHPKGGEHGALPCSTWGSEPSRPEEPHFGVSLSPLRSGISQKQRTFPTSPELILSGCSEGDQQSLLSLLMRRGRFPQDALHPCMLHPCTLHPCALHPHRCAGAEMLSAGEEECRPPKAEQRSAGMEAQREQHCSHPSREGQSLQHPRVGCSAGRCGEHRAAVLQDRSCASSRVRVWGCRWGCEPAGGSGVVAAPKLVGPGQDPCPTDRIKRLRCCSRGSAAVPGVTQSHSAFPCWKGN